MSPAYGCDIGNGFAFISIAGSRDAEPEPVLPPSRDLNPAEGMESAAYVTPPAGRSIEVFDPGRGSARRKIERDPAHAVRAVKMHLAERTLPLPGLERGVSPFEVYGAIARDLVRAGNEERARRGEEPVHRLVVAYPALLIDHVDGIRIIAGMQAAIEAQELDGHRLEVVGKIPEPAAVAIDAHAYLAEHPELVPASPDGEVTLLVYDLGHGTFDTAVVTARAAGEPYQVWASEGLPIGGRDFDARLVDELEDLLEREHDYRVQGAQEAELLRREAVRAKYELSEPGAQEVQVIHQNRATGDYLELSISRERFEEICRDKLAETVELTQAMLEDQLEQGRRVDAVIVSGGASRSPMVKRMLEEVLEPAPPIVSWRPSKAVSFGAARYAAGIAAAEDAAAGAGAEEAPAPPNPVAQLHAQFPYGVLVEDPASVETPVELAVAPGAALPASSEPFYLTTGGGRVSARVYRPRGTAGTGKMRLETCENIAWLHFDTKSRQRYRIVLTVHEDYGVSARLLGEDGTEYQNESERKAG